MPQFTIEQYLSITVSFIISLATFFSETAQVNNYFRYWVIGLLKKADPQMSILFSHTKILR